MSPVIVGLHLWSSPCTVLQTNWLMKAEPADGLFPAELKRGKKYMQIYFLSFTTKGVCLRKEREKSSLGAVSSSWHKQSGGTGRGKWTRRRHFTDIFWMRATVHKETSFLPLLAGGTSATAFPLMRTSTATVLLSGLWFISPGPPGGTVLASEGHLTLGERALKETGWSWPAEPDLILTHTSSIMSLFFSPFAGFVHSFFFLNLFLDFFLIQWNSPAARLEFGFTPSSSCYLYLPGSNVTEDDEEEEEWLLEQAAWHVALVPLNRLIPEIEKIRILFSIIILVTLFSYPGT